MGVNPVIENADLEKRCKPSFWPVNQLVLPGLLFCLNQAAKKPQKSFLHASVRVYSLAMNTTQKQFTLTDVSLNKSKFLSVEK